MSRRGPSLMQAYTELRADYSAARPSRFRKRLTGVSAMGSGADFHLRREADYLHIIELSREFDRNDMVVGQGVTRLIDNVLQDGFKLDPQTGDETLDAELKARFLEWATHPDRCDRAGELNLHAQAKLTLRSVIVDGDVFHLPLAEEGSLQAVEAHRVRTPRNTRRNVALGILLDAGRRRLEYWITRENVEPAQAVIRVGEIKAYPARDAAGHRQVFHVYNPKRFTQTRGLSAFCPIVDPVGMHDDIEFAELVKRQAASCFAILREREIGFVGGDAPRYGERTEAPQPDGSVRTIEGIAPGMELAGAPGEHLVGFSPNIPNPEFFPHALLILTFIAINLHLPVAVLLLDPRQTNFSGWRGAMDQARLGFRAIQKWMEDLFYRPVYEWKVRQYLEADPALQAVAEKSGINLLAHRWSPPSWPYIEPNKDVAADSTIIIKRLNSRRGVLNRRGLDLDDVDRETIADNGSFIESAIAETERINAAHPDAFVDWREVAGMDPKGRKPAVKNQMMEDIGRAVRGGVPVAVSEARSLGLGLAPIPPAGEALLRFNDQDVLEYHLRYPSLLINEIRERLGKAPVDWGNMTPADYLKRLETGTLTSAAPGEPREDEEQKEEEQEEKDEG